MPPRSWEETSGLPSSKVVTVPSRVTRLLLDETTSPGIADKWSGGAYLCGIQGFGLGWGYTLVEEGARTQWHPKSLPGLDVSSHRQLIGGGKKRPPAGHLQEPTVKAINAWGCPSLTVAAHRCSPFQDWFQMSVYLQTTLFAAENTPPEQTHNWLWFPVRQPSVQALKPPPRAPHALGPPGSEYRQHRPLLQPPNEPTPPPGNMPIRKGLSVCLSDCGLFYGTLQLQQRKFNSDWVNLFLTHTHTHKQIFCLNE